MKESWMTVPDFLGYEVSSVGRVRSYRIKGNTTKPVTIPRLLKEFPSGHKQRYVSVKLYKDNKGHSLSIHRLVLEAFVGPKPDGLETRHLNGNAKDNRLENLCYGTHIDNMNDKRMHGTDGGMIGEAHPRAKLTEAQVLDIRSRHAQGLTQIELARYYGLHKTTISLIVHRKKWKHI